MFLLLLCVPFLSIGTISNESQIITPAKTNVSYNQEVNNKLSKTAAQNDPVLTSTSNIGSWKELGPTPLANPNNIVGWGSAPFSGRVTALSVNNSNPQEIYLGAAQGGVWKSLDGGSHWIPLMDGQDSLAVGAIAISPDNHILYVGTGEPNHNADGYYGIGLLKSVDEGKTWTTLGENYFNNSAISSIIISSSNPNNILVSTTMSAIAKGLVEVSNSNGLGVFLSTDGGVTWSPTLQTGTTGTEGIAQMVVNTTNPNNIFAGDFEGVIWESLNGGVSWSLYLNAPTTADQGRVALAVTSANPSLLYAVFVNSTGEIYTMLAYDSSTVTDYYFNNLPTPSSNENGPCGGQCYYNLLIAVDPSNVNTIYVGTNNLYKSIDGGTTWSFLGGAKLNGYLHPDQHAFAFSPANPSVIYSGNDGGIWKSIDGGSTWVTLNTNLGITQFDSISASPSDDAHLLGGVQDNACDIYTNNTSWTIAAGGDGGASMFFNDTTMACNYVKASVRISPDNGLHFYDENTGLNTADPIEFYAPMVQDPSNSSIIYFGSNRIYKTTTDSFSWTDISGVISNDKITSIAVSKSNEKILYEGDTQGIVKISTNGGLNWNEIFNTNTLYSKIIPISSVAVDPFNSSIIMVSLANQTNPRMFYSPDQGANWYYYYLTGVPDVAVNVIKINPITDVPFIGTDRGLYYLNDTGYWNQLGTGLPNAAIFDLTFTASNYLVIGTHGRGAWLNYMTPFITLNTANNTSYKSGSQISFDISDPNGFTNATYHWDSNTNTTASSSMSISIPTSEGQHILYVYAKDPAGNWASKRFNLRTDNTPPVISLSDLSNDTIVDGGSTVNLTVQDDSPIQSVIYNLNGSTNITVSLNNGTINVTIPNSNGQVTLIIYAKDSAGNVVSKNYIFTIKAKESTSSNQTLTTSTTTSSPNSNSESPSSSHNTPGFGLYIFSMSLIMLFFSKKKKK